MRLLISALVILSTLTARAELVSSFEAIKNLEGNFLKLSVDVYVGNKLDLLQQGLFTSTCSTARGSAYTPAWINSGTEVLVQNIELRTEKSGLFSRNPYSSAMVDMTLTGMDQSGEIYQVKLNCEVIKGKSSLETAKSTVVQMINAIFSL